jgi:ketosteroid isomerase-like protein
MNVSVPDDCGNSPRKQFLVEFNRAFAEVDVEFVLEHVSDDVVWTMVGSKEISGKQAMRQAMESMMAAKASSMVLHSVITHGREAAANGEFHYPEGEKVAFCDVYQFTKTTGTTVKRIMSYATSL